MGPPSLFVVLHLLTSDGETVNVQAPCTFLNASYVPSLPLPFAFICYRVFVFPDFRHQCPETMTLCVVACTGILSLNAMQDFQEI